MAIRVAIAQHAMILGGRLRVIIEIAKLLNQCNISPDIITANRRFHPTQIEEHYGSGIDANYIDIHLSHIPLMIDEFNIIRFNRKLHSLSHAYDLIINTNNSLYGLPEDTDIVTYMFFPRKCRINAVMADIHLPEKKLKPISRHGIQRYVLRQLYKKASPTERNEIIGMTKFTASALRAEYPNIEISHIIYPPIDLEQLQQADGDDERVETGKASFDGSLFDIITMGRFSPNKRQLEQIKLAQAMPHINFHIVGFAQNNFYYIQCKEYVERERVQNVYLYPDASFQEMQGLMQKCGIFLHTLINEPFGITAVQAIAAGCIPIVHNSGGQKETVCEPFLRYDTLEQVPEIVRTLQQWEPSQIDELLGSLQDHVQQFDTAVFQQKMQRVLAAYTK